MLNSNRVRLLMKKAEIYGKIALNIFDKKKVEEAGGDEKICVNIDNQRDCSSANNCYWYEDNFDVISVSCRDCFELRGPVYGIEGFGEKQCISFCEGCKQQCGWGGDKEEKCVVEGREGGGGEISYESVIWPKKSEEYESNVVNIADRNKFDPDFIASIIQQESSWNPEAINKDSIGLMQVSKKAIEDMKKKERPCYTGCNSYLEDINYNNVAELENYLKNPTKNIKAGCCYLACLRDEYNIEEEEMLLVAYNWGVGNIRKNCMEKEGYMYYNACVTQGKIPADVQDYVNRIMSRLRQEKDRIKEGFYEEETVYEVEIGLDEDAP